MRVAITAAAVRSRWGTTAAEIYDGLEAAGRSLSAVEGFDASGFGDVEAAQIWREPEAAEDDPALRILGPHGRLLDAVAREAHAAAALESLPREHVGLFVGMGMVDSPIDDLAAAALAARQGGDSMALKPFFAGAYRQIHPLWPLSMLNNVAAGQVAIDLDIRGDNMVLAADGPAGVRALLEAAYSVADGTCAAAIAAAVSGRVSAAALARRSLAPTVLPGDGLAEGGAAFVFEREDVARARDAQILGFVVRGNTSFAGHEGIRTADDGAAVRMAAIHGDFGAGDPAFSLAFELECWRRQAPEPEEATPRRTMIESRGPSGHGILVIEEAA